MVLCAPTIALSLTHIWRQEKKSNKDCLNLFSGKYQRVCQSHFLSAPIPYFISNSMSMVIRWRKVSLFIKLEFFLRPFSRKLILQCSMGFSYPFTSTHSLSSHKLNDFLHYSLMWRKVKWTTIINTIYLLYYGYWGMPALLWCPRCQTSNSRRGPRGSCCWTGWGWPGLRWRSMTRTSWCRSAGQTGSTSRLLCRRTEKNMKSQCQNRHRHKLFKDKSSKFIPLEASSCLCDNKFDFQI